MGNAESSSGGNERGEEPKETKQKRGASGCGNSSEASGGRVCTESASQYFFADKTIGRAGSSQQLIFWTAFVEHIWMKGMLGDEGDPLPFIQKITIQRKMTMTETYSGR